MLLRLNLFLLEDRVKRERGKPFRNLESLLFSDSICLSHFTDEEFEAQGGEFTPAELDEHGLIFTLITKLCALPSQPLQVFSSSGSFRRKLALRQ